MLLHPDNSGANVKLNPLSLIIHAYCIIIPVCVAVCIQPLLQNKDKLKTFQ